MCSEARRSDIDVRVYNRLMRQGIASRAVIVVVKRRASGIPCTVTSALSNLMLFPNIPRSERQTTL